MKTKPTENGGWEMTDYEKKLVEIARLIKNSQGQRREDWINYLLGYILGLDEISKLK